MKNVCSILFGLMLSVCLSLYGSFGVAKAGATAVLSMEICIDGVAKTVLFDAQGAPVEPAQDCPECLDCCQAVAALTPVACLSLPFYALLGTKVGRIFSQTPNITNRNLYHAPRGPPTVQESELRIPMLTIAYRPVISQIMHVGGRPVHKDATA